MYSHGHFSPLGIDFGPFGIKDVQGGFLTIHGPNEIITGNDKVTNEKKQKDLYFRYLISEVQTNSHELQRIVKRSLVNDFINHQRAVEVYINGLNACLSKVHKHQDKRFLSQYRCKGKFSDKLHEALKVMKNIAKNGNTSYMDYYISGSNDNLSDSRFEIPGIGSIRYYETDDTYILENNIFSENYLFKLYRIKCDSSKCLLVVKDDIRVNSDSKDIYDLNHPATRVGRN